MLFRILAGLVADAQLDGIETEHDRQLVHGAFAGEHAHGFAGRPAGAGLGQVQLDHAVRHQAVVAGIEGARRQAGGFVVGEAAGGMGPAFVGHRLDTALAVGAQADALDGGRAVVGDLEHLLAGEGDLDRPADGASGHGTDQGVGIDRQLATEAATDIARHDAHVFLGQLQGIGHATLRLLDELGGAVDGHPVAVPLGEAGVGLHLRMDVVGRGIALVELDRRPGKGGIHIARGGIGGLIGIRRLDRLAEVGGEIENTRFGRVVDLHHGRRQARLLEGLGHHEGHRLAEIAHLVAVEVGLGPGEATAVLRLAGGLARRVAIGQHAEHARRALRGRGIQPADTALGDGGPDDEAVGDAIVAEFEAVGRLAGDLEQAVDAVDGLADQAAAILVDQVAAGGFIHFHAAVLRPVGERRPRRRTGCGGSARA